MPPKARLNDQDTQIAAAYVLLEHVEQHYRPRGAGPELSFEQLQINRKLTKLQGLANELLKRAGEDEVDMIDKVTDRQNRDDHGFGDGNFDDLHTLNGDTVRAPEHMR